MSSRRPSAVSSRCLLKNGNAINTSRLGPHDRDLAGPRDAPRGSRGVRWLLTSAQQGGVRTKVPERSTSDMLECLKLRNIDHTS